MLSVGMFVRDTSQFTNNLSRDSYQEFAGFNYLLLGEDCGMFSRHGNRAGNVITPISSQPFPEATMHAAAS